MQNTITKSYKNPNITTFHEMKSNDISFLQSVERKLKTIFSDELNSSNSIFLKVSDNVIHNLALFISGQKNRTCSIGIAGETASGKSTITLDIIDTIEKFAQEFDIHNAITRINTDDYYYDRSDMVKKAGSFAEFAKHYDLDVPEALELSLMKDHIHQILEGKTVYLPKYDMSGTAIRNDNVQKAEPSKVIISEGLFTLTEDVVDAFDFKIYVHVSRKAQKERFYRRAEERNLGSSVDEVYSNAYNKAQIHIHPTAEKADIILSGESDREAYKTFVNKIIALVKELHFNKVLLYS